MSSFALEQAPYGLELKTPVEAACSPAWLDELRAFRGRELYAGGRRPAFRVGDDRYLDADEHDRYAYHLLSRCPRTGALVGSMRFLPIEGSPTSQVESAIGRARADFAIAELGATRRTMMETARWIVRPDQAHRGIGITLFAGGFALCRALEYEGLWCTAGVKDGQTRFMMHLGFLPIPGAPVFSSERYADDICLLMAHASRLTPRFGARVERMLPPIRALLAASPSGRMDCARRAGYMAFTAAARSRMASAVSSV